MKQETFEIRTGTTVVTDITSIASEFCADVGDGLLSLFVPHATAGVALMELGSGSEADLEEIIETLLPRDFPYRHRHGYRGHGADHVLPVFVAPSLTLPLKAGRMLLGVWQSIVLVDPNRDNHRRRVVMTAING